MLVNGCRVCEVDLQKERGCEGSRLTDPQVSKRVAAVFKLTHLAFALVQKCERAWKRYGEYSFQIVTAREELLSSPQYQSWRPHPPRLPRPVPGGSHFPDKRLQSTQTVEVRQDVSKVHV